MQWSHLPGSPPANSLYPLPLCGHCLQSKSCKLQNHAGINGDSTHESKHSFLFFSFQYWPTCNCHSLSEAKGDLLWIALNTLELHALGVPIHLGQEHGLPVKSIQTIVVYLQSEIHWECSLHKKKLSKAVRETHCTLGIPFKSDFYACYM